MITIFLFDYCLENTERQTYPTEMFLFPDESGQQSANRKSEDVAGDDDSVDSIDFCFVEIPNIVSISALIFLMTCCGVASCGNEGRNCSMHAQDRRYVVLSSTSSAAFFNSVSAQGWRACY